MVKFPYLKVPMKKLLLIVLALLPATLSASDSDWNHIMQKTLPSAQSVRIKLQEIEKRQHQELQDKLRAQMMIAKK